MWCSAMFGPTATDEMAAPETSKNRLNGDNLTFGRRIDLESIADVNADVGHPVVRIGVCSAVAKTSAA